MADIDIIGMSMYYYRDGNVPNTFRFFFHIARNIYDNDICDIRNADDIQVPYGRLDIRRFSIRIAKKGRCMVLSFECLFRRRSKKISKLSVTGLYDGNSPVTGDFPAQTVSNAENVSIR